MLDIIVNNPYRILGVLANAPKRDVVANEGKIKAFMAVGRQVSFPYDFDCLLPTVLRSEENVSKAASCLTLPIDKLKYAQFWFIDTGRVDDIALKKLSNGDTTTSKEIWSKVHNISSLQNRIVLSLTTNQLEVSILLGQELYTKFARDFTTLILGENSSIDVNSIHHTFLNELCESFDFKQILPHITLSEWKDYAIKRYASPLLEEIQNAIDRAKSSKGKGSSARLIAGNELMIGTRKLLIQLGQLISHDNIQFQITVDKLGLEILQCAIDYYNEARDDDAANKAIKLYKYAQSIVVSKSAKDRCDENVGILEAIISELPPVEVMDNHKSIISSLESFSKQPDLISYSISLIKECVPHILSIKEKLGTGHKYYLKISTAIVNNALGNIISEVNKAQNGDMDTLKATLIEAWRAQLYLDKFDLTPEYKNGRYKECREALRDIIARGMGFEDKRLSFMYTYGCGWCNDLDVSDIDLRTEEELYDACKRSSGTNSKSIYRVYLKRYPNGKHKAQVSLMLEKYEYNSCKSISEYENFLRLYPASTFAAEARRRIAQLKELERKREEEEKIRRHNEADKRLFMSCKTIHNYQTYLAKYPNGLYANQAKEEIKRLKKKITTIIVSFGVLILIVIISSLIVLPSCSSSNDKDGSIDNQESFIISNNDEYSNESQSLEANADDAYVAPTKTQEEIDYETYINNQLKTGARPYKKYYHKWTGQNYIEVKTFGTDYVVIVKECMTSEVVNHIYIRANDRGRLYLPNGTYTIYFYGGKGWNPNKENGKLIGGFVSECGLQKDGPITLNDQYCEYTLYPVQNGNLILEQASKNETF